MTAAEPLDPERLAAIKARWDRRLPYLSDVHDLLGEVERLQARIREQIFRERECADLAADPLVPPVMVPCSVVADDLQRILDGGAS